MHGEAIDFSDANNDQGTQYSTDGPYNLLYYGQGAYSDPGNNIWNGFGQTPGPGSEYFYGPGLSDNPNLPGNPGNPYAWSLAESASGSNLFNPANEGTANTGNATSAGILSSVTLALGSYEGDNGLSGHGTDPNGNGTPSFLLGEAAIVLGNESGHFYTRPRRSGDL